MNALNQGDVMGLIDCSGEQYAVVEARWTEDRPERFIIAYRDEKSLRDLIAAPSILAIGFASREGAASGAAYLSTGGDSKKSPGALAADRNEDEQSATQSPKQRWQDRFGLAETRALARTLRHVVTAATLMFHPRNVLLVDP